MRLLVFAGSTRQGSYNRKLATATTALARAAGAEVTHIELGDFDVPMYNADLEAKGTPADVIRLKQLGFDHPAWIICAPEYNASYPALLKNTLDWISSPVKADPAWTDGFKSTRGKVVGMLSASPVRSAACARKAIWRPCCSTCTAGWRRRTSPSVAPATPSMPTVTWSQSRRARTCRPSSTRCSGPRRASSSPEHPPDNPVESSGTTAGLSTGPDGAAKLSLLA
jgi:NAD(P)H-dependent FMN reductase